MKFSNNNLSLWGLKSSMDLKLRIPDDLTVIIFDENEALDLLQYHYHSSDSLWKRCVILLSKFCGRKWQKILMQESKL